MKTRAEIELEITTINTQIDSLYSMRKELEADLRKVNDTEVTAKYGIATDDQIKMTFPLVAFLREIGWSEGDIDTWVTKRQLYIELAGNLDSVTVSAHDLAGNPKGGLVSVPIEIVLYARRMWLADNA